MADQEFKSTQILENSAAPLRVRRGLLGCWAPQFESNVLKYVLNQIACLKNLVQQNLSHMFRQRAHDPAR
jgi:hypothetical protein